MLSPDIEFKNKLLCNKLCYPLKTSESTSKIFLLLVKHTAAYQMKFLLELFTESTDGETLIPLPEDCSILFYDDP